MRTEAVKAAARRNRDGGVKSPGSPFIPEPRPKGARLNVSIDRGCYEAVIALYNFLS